MDNVSPLRRGIMPPVWGIANVMREALLRQYNLCEHSSDQIRPSIALRLPPMGALSKIGLSGTYCYLLRWHHPSPRQCENTFFQRARFAAMQYHSPDKRRFALQIFSEGANAGCVAGGYLTACLDL